MPEPRSFDYTVVRIVPRPDRGEFVNVGVILFSREARFLGGRFDPDWDRITCLDPAIDQAEAARQIDHLKRVVAGESGSGPIAAMSPSKRFHWLSGPRSTVVQVSPMHSGICHDPEEMLEQVFKRLVGTIQDRD